MDYTNNEEFIEDVTACTLHLNSMEDEWDRIPVNLALAASMEAFNRGFEAKNIWIRLLRNSAFNFANNLELLKKKFMEFATEL